MNTDTEVRPPRSKLPIFIVYVVASALVLCLFDSLPLWHLADTVKIKILLVATLVWAFTFGFAMATCWRRGPKKVAKTNVPVVLVCMALVCVSPAPAMAWHPTPDHPGVLPEQAPEFHGTTYQIYSVTNGAARTLVLLSGTNIFINNEPAGILLPSGIIAQADGSALADKDGNQLMVSTNAQGIRTLTGIDKKGDPTSENWICGLLVLAVAGYVIYKLWRCAQHLLTPKTNSTPTNASPNNPDDPAVVGLEPLLSNALANNLASLGTYRQYGSQYGGTSVSGSAPGLSAQNIEAVTNAVATEMGGATSDGWQQSGDWLGNPFNLAVVVTNAFLSSFDLSAWATNYTYTLGLVGGPVDSNNIPLANATVTAITYDQSSDAPFMTNWYLVATNTLSRVAGTAGLPLGLGRPRTLFIRHQTP